MNDGVVFATVGLILVCALLFGAWWAERREERAWWREPKRGDYVEIGRKKWR